MSRPQILFLDAYDSFTNNIVSLLTTLLDADVHVLPIDSPLIDQASADFGAVFRRELAHYHAVVCGPGPGSPAVDRDVGLMRFIWTLEEESLLPVLGVCLGFQSLVLSAGGRIRRLRRGLHGIVRDIRHQKPAGHAVKGDIFGGVGSFGATLYHSLCADVGQDVVTEGEWEAGGARWQAQAQAPELVPLAWVDEAREEEMEGAERILMAVKHTSKPFWGLQYHPESICTQAAGHDVLRNWFAEAMRWHNTRGRKLRVGESVLARDATRPSLLSEVRLLDDAAASDEALWTMTASPMATFGLDCEYHSRSIPVPAHIKVPDIVEALRSTQSEHIILDSANADKLARGAPDVRGKHSIIALDVEEAMRIEYHVGDAFATARMPGTAKDDNGSEDHREVIPLQGSGQRHRGIWQLLADFMDRRSMSPSDPNELPFKGGFMGYITYELGLGGIDVKPHERGHRRPDLCFAWVTKSIVVDHIRNMLHVQHLQNKKLNAEFWIDSTVSALESSPSWREPFGFTPPAASNLDIVPVLATPDPTEYEDKVRKCQEYIAAGESYELCLTDQTTISLPSSAPRNGHTQSNGHLNGHSPSSKLSPAPATSDLAWSLYRTLRTRQPAPFGSFLRLGGATLVSSSPERFLEYSPQGLCSMRPMKGTVRKSPEVPTLSAAETILHVPKEEAENLMIVDLVRHDLHGVCGSGNVSVPHLMKVEEYASVFQMITIVEAQLPGLGAADGATNGAREEEKKQQHQYQGYTGLDVLAASLPPGSMTGAPKKRSCELLQEIEGGQERSLYSGVVGYMDVTGRGDWSVTIRTMFHWDDEDDSGSGSGTNGSGEGRETWRIGAGGAVTILSTPEGERDEMFTKLGGPLGIFSEK